MDPYGFNEDVVDDALHNAGGAYGITNVTAPRIKPGSVSGQYFFVDATDLNCSISQFSDPLHPTELAHRLIGQMALAAAVPEPGSVVLVLMAGSLLVVGRRRRRPV